MQNHNFDVSKNFYMRTLKTHPRKQQRNKCTSSLQKKCHWHHYKQLKDLNVWRDHSCICIVTRVNTTFGYDGETVKSPWVHFHIKLTTFCQTSHCFTFFKARSERDGLVLKEVYVLFSWGKWWEMDDIKHQFKW